MRINERRIVIAAERTLLFVFLNIFRYGFFRRTYRIAAPDMPIQNGTDAYNKKSAINPSINNAKYFFSFMNFMDFRTQIMFKKFDYSKTFMTLNDLIPSDDDEGEYTDEFKASLLRSLKCKYYSLEHIKEIYKKR